MVKKIIVEHLGVDEAKVTDEASFIDDLGADSLDTVELVMAFEECHIHFLKHPMRHRLFHFSAKHLAKLHFVLLLLLMY